MNGVVTPNRVIAVDEVIVGEALTLAVSRS